MTPLGSSRSVSVDVSLVCATHRNLRDEVATGRFREDLYYRLNGLRIQLPPLRLRADIHSLIDATIESEGGGRQIEIDPATRVALARHPWPGNIREMQMVLRTALAIMGRETTLTFDHLPEEFTPTEQRDAAFAPPADPSDTDLAHIELAAIRRAVAAANGNVSKAARALGISRKTLYRKLAQMQPGSGAPDDGLAGTRK